MSFYLQKFTPWQFFWQKKTGGGILEKILTYISAHFIFLIWTLKRSRSISNNIETTPRSSPRPATTTTRFPKNLFNTLVLRKRCRLSLVPVLRQGDSFVLNRLSIHKRINPCVCLIDSFLLVPVKNINSLKIGFLKFPNILTFTGLPMTNEKNFYTWSTSLMNNLSKMQWR